MVNHTIMMNAMIGLHAFHGVWSIVIMGVIGASMTQTGSASGAARFMFAMCWLNIPTLIYLTMSPRFPRTKILAHPYWLMGMNTIYSILWFAAFVSLAVYTNGGISDGESKETDENKKKAGGCAVFQAGTGETEKACTLNKSSIILGVFMWFVWLATTGIAGYAAWYFKQHTISPFDDYKSPSHEIQEATQAAFSSNDDYAPLNRTTPHQQEDFDEYDTEASRPPTHGRSGSVASSTYNSTYSYGEAAHPGRPLSWAAEREPYAGIGGHAPIAPAHGDAMMPDIPDDYSYRGGGARG
ncbi:hypothetical protein BZA05DRAFT_248037 [Tricharina praecox]|uniref:uncharacterized protein n=1 Tax=Tricharina praecox TaxID=43433 RepID=UPI002220440F|nr:uncharacterized protein BZA05DRAFT_248037 [Tricharina praecox]KAI5854712.1 hypothetical protein BZA05DRAFT_248037 [Tricharina praecox]